MTEETAKRIADSLERQVAQSDEWFAYVRERDRSAIAHADRKDRDRMANETYVRSSALVNETL